MVEERNGRIGGWSTFDVPRGARLRYVLNESEEDTAGVGLVFGEREELTVELPVTMAAEVIVTLQTAIKDARARQIRRDPASVTYADES